MSIFKIQITGGKPAIFNPTPQIVFVNDSVFWFNADPNNAHWPAPSASNPTGFMPFQIAPNTPSSQVSFDSVQVIPYICVNHPGETGQINVKPGKKSAFGGKTKKGAFGGKTKKGAFGGKTKKGAFGGKTKKGAFGGKTKRGCVLIPFLLMPFLLIAFLLNAFLHTLT